MERLAPASRPDARRRVFGLDLARALAVLCVLGAHASELLERLVTAPRLAEALAVSGVELFFVLSGFLIGGIIIDGVRRDGRWIAEFWTRRWLRTLPNYFVFLALNVVIFRALYGRWPAFASYLVFAQGLAWPHPQFFNEAWSLAVEEVFYLLAPLLAAGLLPLGRTRIHVVVLLLAAAGVVGVARIAYVHAYDPNWDMGVRKVALLRLDALVYGIVAAYVCRRWRLGPGVRAALAVAGLVMAGYAIWLLVIGWVQASPLWRAIFFSELPAGFAALLPLAASFDGASLPRPVIATTSRVALWAYAVYLVNLPVERLLTLFHLEPATPAGAAGYALAFIAVTLVSSAATYRWLERPIMERRDRVVAWLGLA
jgi:peptidoglycan/LPS O-acetylase OafA/YrhL